jgi:hypothetical protein
MLFKIDFRVFGVFRAFIRSPTIHVSRYPSIQCLVYPVYRGRFYDFPIKSGESSRFIPRLQVYFPTQKKCVGRRILDSLIFVGRSPVSPTVAATALTVAKSFAG